MKDHQLRTCLICGPKADKRHFFRFPNDEIIQRKWIDFLGYPHDWKVKQHYYLCQYHFVPTDFTCPPHLCPKRLRLIRTAVPRFSEPVPDKHTVLDEYIVDNYSETVDNDSLTPTTSKFSHGITSNDENEALIFVKRNCPSENITDTFQVEEETRFREPICDITNENRMSTDITSHSVVNVDGIVCELLNKDTVSEISGFATPTTRHSRIKRHSYLGDVRSPDLATPEGAKRAFQLARRKAMEYKRKLKTLQQKYNRLEKRFIDVMHELGREEIISEYEKNDTT